MLLKIFKGYVNLANVNTIQVLPDAKVASDLGVPRIWVAETRDTMFGPEGSNEEIRKGIAEAKAVLVEAKTLKETLGAFLARVERVEKSIQGIEKSLI